MKAFELDGGLIGLLSRPRRFRTLTLTGLQINIPPGFKKGSEPGQGPPTRTIQTTVRQLSSSIR